LSRRRIASTAGSSCSARQRRSSGQPSIIQQAGVAVTIERCWHSTFRNPHYQPAARAGGAAPESRNRSPATASVYCHVYASWRSLAAKRPAALRSTWRSAPRLRAVAAGPDKQLVSNCLLHRPVSDKFCWGGCSGGAGMAWAVGRNDKPNGGRCARQLLTAAPRPLKRRFPKNSFRSRVSCRSRRV
jgi:hypothetical protein